MNKTFAEQYRLGAVDENEIDDFIDVWHNSEEDISIFDFLGLTEDQYAEFVQGEFDFKELLEEE